MPNRLFLLILFAIPALSWPHFGYSQYAWQGVQRVVAVGDVHGAYTELVELLKGAALIDEQLDWQGGTTHLVSLGDLLDRGAHSRRAMDLFMKLQTQAQQHGGRVHVLLGNHELMNLSGDLRDVSAAEHAALQELGGHAKAFAADGRYGRWLTSLPFIIRINDTVFTHGGLPPLLRDTSLDAANMQAQKDLQTLLTEGQRLRQTGLVPADADLMTATHDASEEDLAAMGKAFVAAADSPLLGEAGPLWYRGTAACHGVIEEPLLSANLKALDAQRVVVGHTPTPNREINTRLGQQVYIIDTGMLASVYKGNARLLEFSGEQVTAWDQDGAAAAITHLPKPDPVTQLSTADYEITNNSQGTTHLTFDTDDNLTGLFRKLSKRDANRALAAYRLDRALQLHMVPSSVRRQIGKHTGVVFAWTNRPFSESTRQQSNLGRPNWCAQGSDYALLAAFDALIGKQDRNANNLWYERGTLNIRITENFKAFGTSTKLPQTNGPRVLPSALLTPLRQLNMDNLTELLDTLVKPKEIAALLKRRDAILQWPVSP